MNLQSAMAAKAAGPVLTTAQLQEAIARASSDATGPGHIDTDQARQRQVGLG